MADLSLGRDGKSWKMMHRRHEFHVTGSGSRRLRESLSICVFDFRLAERWTMDMLSLKVQTASAFYIVTHCNVIQPFKE